MADAWMLRDGQNRVADEHQRQSSLAFAQVGQEIVEELLAALVLVDAADIDREGSADVELLPESLRLRRLAESSDPTPTTTDGTLWLPATAWIIARSSGELYIRARTPRKIGPNIDSPTAGSRSAVGTRIALRRHRAHGVIRVVDSDS